MAKNKASKKAAKANKAKDQVEATEEKKEEVAKPTAKEVKAAKALAITEAFNAKFSKPSKSKAAIGKAIVSKELAGIKSSTEIGGLLADAKFYFPNGKGDVDGKALFARREASAGPIALLSICIGHGVLAKAHDAVSPHTRFFASDLFEDLQQIESVLALAFRFDSSKESFHVPIVFFCLWFGHRGLLW